MSVTPTAPAVPGTVGQRRVRHQVRDAMVLMAFSATASVGVALGFLLLSQLGRSGR